ncbi:MAG: SgcJ/EcaC family oxidoreductase [Actinomycetota bacterium]|nr:SgcJ/EcaC family oxidoreductase [Actinomycetota bacterium]
MSFSAEAEVATRDIYARLLGAWNARDAGGFAALFAEDGVSIGFDGSQVTGEEIRDHIGGIFSDHRPLLHRQGLPAAGPVSLGRLSSTPSSSTTSGKVSAPIVDDLFMGHGGGLQFCRPARRGFGRPHEWLASQNAGGVNRFVVYGRA